MQTVLLVEGTSDRVAIETLALRREQDLTGIRLVVLGGPRTPAKCWTSSVRAA
jgi:hypothetical protein